MHPAQQAPPPQHYQPIPQQYQQPPTQQFPPTQQSSIQIPVGSAPPKVVSTACIYPSHPGKTTCILVHDDADLLVRLVLPLDALGALRQKLFLPPPQLLPLLLPLLLPQLLLQSHLSPALQLLPQPQPQLLLPLLTDPRGCLTATSPISSTQIRPPPPPP